MDVKRYSMSIMTESQVPAFEKWLDDHNITYSRTGVVECAGYYHIDDGGPVRAYGFLLLMTESDYDEMMKTFNLKTE